VEGGFASVGGSRGGLFSYVPQAIVPQGFVVLNARACIVLNVRP
jgi:hypothetical protein